MRRPPHDMLVFGLCVATAITVLASVISAAVVALRLGAFSHAHGLLLNMCTAVLQFTGGVTALALLALPALVLASGLVHAALFARCARRQALLMLSQPEDLPEGLLVAVRHAGIAGRVDLVRSRSAEMFVHGLLRPRMLVTTAAMKLLSDPELAAVVHHEAHHIHRRDPLRLVFAHAAARSLFMFPLVRQLARQLTVATELAADRRAIQRSDVLDLASALTKFLKSPQVVGAPGLALDPTSDARLAQLLDPDHYAHRISVTPTCIAATIATLGTLPLMVALLGALPAMHLA